MTTQPTPKDCRGYPCFPPRDCCKEGCCTPTGPSIYKPPVTTGVNIFNPVFLGHWYFWLAVTATVAGILCACSIWRRKSHRAFCCKDSGRDERASEPDSNGSCYAPPQYSRCNSFHQAPPPYSEVTTKPDLYPVIINYNGDAIVKNISTGYSMVQYFRNFIVRPVGSLSATSTIDSLSSSFICNAANEANTIIPPTYSCTGSLEEVDADGPEEHSPSLFSGADICQSHSSSVHSHLNVTPCHHAKQVTVSIRDNPCFGATNIINNSLNDTTSVPNLDPLVSRIESKSQNNCDASPYSRVKKCYNVQKMSKDRSQDSESQDEEHNFSDLLNLSVCLPSSMPVVDTPVQSHLQELHYSVTNSMTDSDISSLACGSPGSPPRATSPTQEMKELLDKIQQLPQQKSPTSDDPKRINRIRAKTLYMPLQEGPKTKGAKLKGWLSRSAPNTPCATFIPSFPPCKKSSSQKNSAIAIGDCSPLLKEHHEETEEERNDFL